MIMCWQQLLWILLRQCIHNHKGQKKKKKSVGSSPQKEICFRPELNDKHNIILEICGQSEFLFAGIQPQQNI